MFFTIAQGTAISGLDIPVNGGGLGNRGLPLAGDELQRIDQSDAPTLAAEGAHFANVAYIDDSVAMYALKLFLTQAFLDSA
jgi:hypothetical protein